MPVPPLSELENAAKQMVWKAKKQGNLREFTPRLVRRALEKQYKLEGGTLDESDFKSAIKVATKAALDESPPIVDEEEEEGSAMEAKGSPPKKKRHKSNKIVKNDDTVKAASTSKGKRKAKEKAIEEEDVDATEDELESANKKRKVIHDKKPSVDVGKDADKSSPRRNPNTKGREHKNKFKSAEHVFSSDVEHEEPAGSEKPKPSPSKKTTMTSDKSASRDKPISSIGDSLTNKKGKVSEEVGAKSESELSVLEDDEPAPKRKKKSKPADKESKKPSKSKGKTSGPPENKDEDTIKRLKSLVVACGVRKVWSKVFQGLDTPQQQIRKLKEMLAELGMSGRMSMEQAKAIKEKRELAQELEDVQAFATAVEGGVARTRSRITKGVRDQSSSDEHSSEDGSPMAARKSIMAFLQDQSSDDE